MGQIFKPFRTHLWKGFHDPKLLELLAECWKKDELLIICPPLQQDFGFVSHLPSDEIFFHGEWQTIPVLPKVNKAQSFPEKPILGVFTSGTLSGGSKLVFYSKSNVEASLGAIRGLFDRVRIQNIFCYPQPFHTFGLTLGYLHTVLYGGQLISGLGKYSSAHHEKWLANQDSKTLTLGTPTHLKDLLGWVNRRRAVPRPSYSCIIGGAKVEVALWKNLQTVLGIDAPSIGYGATEACPGITHLEPGIQPESDGDVGNLLNGVSVELVSGEGLWFDGPNRCVAIAQGQDLQFPKKILIKDEIHKSQSGRYIYEGRTDLVINRGGAKVSLEFLEDLLKEHLGIRAVCVPVSDDRLGQEVALLISSARDRGLVDQIKDQIKKTIEVKMGFSIKVDYIHPIAEIPHNTSLKIDRKRSSEIFSEKNTEKSARV